MFFHCFKTKQLPLKIYLSGSAGVGKRIVINTIFQLLTRYFNDIPILGEYTDNNKIVLCAQTGQSAFIIGGSTFHSAFALPVSKFNESMPRLSDDIASKIRQNFIHIKLSILTEFQWLEPEFFQG